MFVLNICNIQNAVIYKKQTSSFSFNKAIYSALQCTFLWVTPRKKKFKRQNQMSSGLKRAYCFFFKLPFIFNVVAVPVEGK